MVRLGASVRKRTGGGGEKDYQQSSASRGRAPDKMTMTKGASDKARTVSPSPEAVDRTASSTPPSSSTSERRSSSGNDDKKSSSNNRSNKQSDSRRRLARDVRHLSDSDPEETNQICTRLVSATRSPMARADFTESGGTSALVAALDRHKSNRRIVVSCCIILQNLAVDTDQCRRIANARGIQALVGAMKVHATDESVQEVGCAALRNLGSGDASTKASIASGGGILVIVTAMRYHSGPVAVQEQAMRALRNLAKDSDSNRIAIAGTVPAIIGSMGKLQASEDVQREGCATLRNLSVSPDNQVAIAACGGVGAISVALSCHPKTDKVQVQGCGALFNMSFSPLALAAMKREGKAFKKLLKHAAKKFPDGCGQYVQGITERLPYAAATGGAETAWPLPIDLTAASAGRDTDSASASTEGGGSPTLKILSHVQRLSEHTTSSEDEIKTAIADLARLAVNYDHRIAISAAGGIDVIIGAMAQRIDSPSIQRVGCSAVQNLSCNEDNEVAITDAGGVSTIIAAMDMYPDNVKLQHKACAALRNLAASNNDNRNRIRDDGGIHSIVDAMRRNDGEKSVQEVACSALGNLSLQNEENRVLIAECGAIPRILLALMTHTNAAGVQEKGCRALYNLSLTPSNVKLIRYEEPESVLWDAASKFPAECGEWTQRLLQKL